MDPVFKLRWGKGDTAGSLFKLVSYTTQGSLQRCSRSPGQEASWTSRPPTVLGQPLAVDVEPRLGADWDIRLNPNVINQSLVIPTGMEKEHKGWPCGDCLWLHCGGLLRLNLDGGVT